MLRPSVTSSSPAVRTGVSWVSMKVSRVGSRVRIRVSRFTGISIRVSRVRGVSTRVRRVRISL